MTDDSGGTMSHEGNHYTQKRDGMRYCLLMPSGEEGMLGAQIKNSILLTLIQMKLEGQT